MNNSISHRIIVGFPDIEKNHNDFSFIAGLPFRINKGDTLDVFELSKQSGKQTQLTKKQQEHLDERNTVVDVVIVRRDNFGCYLEVHAFCSDETPNK